MGNCSRRHSGRPLNFNSGTLRSQLPPRLTMTPTPDFSPSPIFPSHQKKVLLVLIMKDFFLPPLCKSGGTFELLLRTESSPSCVIGTHGSHPSRLHAKRDRKDRSDYRVVWWATRPHRGVDEDFISGESVCASTSMYTYLAPCRVCKSTSDASLMRTQGMRRRRVHAGTSPSRPHLPTTCGSCFLTPDI